MTFAQRGELLKQMANALHEHREELLDIAERNNGGTRGDAKFDVDGATGTLASYARLGEKLGEGGQATVVRGKWNGIAPVGTKLICAPEDTASVLVIEDRLHFFTRGMRALRERRYADAQQTQRNHSMDGPPIKAAVRSGLSRLCSASYSGRR